MEHRIYLSRRNLEVLLSKLDRKKAGEDTHCTIVKFKNKDDPFVQTLAKVSIQAVEDEEYYVNRPAGAMHEKDVKEVRHTTGSELNLVYNLLTDPLTRPKMK